MALLDPSLLNINYELDKQNLLNYETNETNKANKANNSTKSLKEKTKKKNMKKRCNFEGCNKKLGLLPFVCDCNMKFCALHRLPEAHSCTFDYVEKGKCILKKKNPKVVNAKITEI